MKKNIRILVTLMAVILIVGIFPVNAFAANPFLPLWERVPDGEPRVFEDPDNPGKYRLYVYGSHDIRVSGYCGPDHVVWSAPVEDPNNWRYDGLAFHVDQLNGVDYVDSDGVTKQLVVDVAAIPAFTDSLGASHQGSTGKNIRVQLYAPDAVYHPENDKYYMYLFVDGMWHVNPNSTGVPPQRRHPMFVVESDSPAGPFTNPKFVTLAFDPAVLVDDVKNEDGKSRVYLYWTPEESRNLRACELDPDDMATILPGTMHYPFGETAQAPNNTLPDWTAPFHMFEGSSIRKVNGTYLMAYCRGERTTQTATSNISEIGWAYSDNPFGDPAAGTPWTYGGVVVSNKGEQVVNPYTGASTFTFNGGNIHGGMAEVNGQWYQVYHRNSNVNGKRQAMAEPFNLRFEDGVPVIDQVEMISQGFEINGLDPYKEQYASYACYTIPASGPQFFSQTDATAVYDPNAERDNWYPAQQIRNQNWLGYKYFNFEDGVPDSAKLKLALTLKALTAGTTINIYASDAKEKFSDPEQPKTLIGSIKIDEANTDVHTIEGVIDNVDVLTGKQGIYLEFLNAGVTSTTNLVELNTLQFILESDLVLTTEAHNVKAGDYFTLNTHFREAQNSNTVILNYTFDGGKFEYANYTPAAGVSVVDTQYGDGYAKIALMIPSYAAESLGDIMLRAKEDAPLRMEKHSVSVEGQYVLKDEAGTKTISTASASASFTSGSTLTGDTNGDGVVDIIDLSNMIDWFGTKSNNAKWDSLYTFFDFNNNGQIDIYDITYVAKLIN